MIVKTSSSEGRRAQERRKEQAMAPWLGSSMPGHGRMDQRPGTM